MSAVAAVTVPGSVVDSIAANGAAYAASDFIGSFIILLFRFWVVVRYIFEAISRTVRAVDSCDGVGINEARNFSAVHATPLGRVRAAIRATVV